MTTLERIEHARRLWLDGLTYTADKYQTVGPVEYAADEGAVEVVPAEQLRGAVEDAREEMARHLHGMAADPSWKPEVQAAFRYAAQTFTDSGGR